MAFPSDVLPKSTTSKPDTMIQLDDEISTGTCLLSTPEIPMSPSCSTISSTSCESDELQEGEIHIHNALIPGTGSFQIIFSTSKKDFKRQPLLSALKEERYTDKKELYHHQQQHRHHQTQEDGHRHYMKFETDWIQTGSEYHPLQPLHIPIKICPRDQLTIIIRRRNELNSTPGLEHEIETQPNVPSLPSSSSSSSSVDSSRSLYPASSSQRYIHRIQTKIVSTRTSSSSPSSEQIGHIVAGASFPAAALTANAIVPFCLMLQHAQTPALQYRESFTTFRLELSYHPSFTHAAARTMTPMPLISRIPFIPTPSYGLTPSSPGASYTVRTGVYRRTLAELSSCSIESSLSRQSFAHAPSTTSSILSSTGPPQSNSASSEKISIIRTGNNGNKPSEKSRSHRRRLHDLLQLSRRSDKGATTTASSTALSTSKLGSEGTGNNDNVELYEGAGI